MSAPFARKRLENVRLNVCHPITPNPAFSAAGMANSRMKDFYDLSVWRSVSNSRKRRSPQQFKRHSNSTHTAARIVAVAF